MTLRVDLDSPMPVYRQIVDALRLELVNGSFNPGDQLPPVRQLAMDLGIHFNTVAEAYRILSEEGWLDLKRRRGAVVIARAKPGRPEPETSGQFIRRLRELVAEGRAQGLAPQQIARELKVLAEGLKK